MDRRILIIGGVAVALVLGVAAYFLVPLMLPAPKPVAVFGEPTDIVKDFYQPWLEARLSTTTDPYRLGLADAPVLSAELRKSIKRAKKDALDPVLCQSAVPPEFSTRTISATAEKVEILIMARASESPEQAIVTVLPLDGGWYIDSIRCSPGEFAPEREFSFDNHGYLIKDVPPPLDATRWYLIFTENGELGHYAPLTFGANSVCVNLGGAEVSCDSVAIAARSAAHVQGEMTELGVEVKRLQITEAPAE